MGTRSTVKGYWRQGGNSASNNATPGVSLLATPVITFDPTQVSSTATTIRLPKGAIPSHGVVTNAGSTGGVGTNTVDVGLAGGTVDALIAEGDADTASAALLTTGTSLGVALLVDTLITAGAGAVAATGGTVSVRVFYYMNDDGVLNN